MRTAHYKTQEGFEKACKKIPEQCGKCEHFMCFPHLRWVYCQERKPFKEGCEGFLDTEKYRSRNKDKDPLPVAWEKEYAYTADKMVNVPYCPTCGEYAAIEEGACRFCGQPFLDGDDPREPNIEVSYEKDGHVWKLTEVGEYHHHWYEKDGEPIMHTENTQRHTEAELLDKLKAFVEDGVYDLLSSIGDE